MDTKVFYKRNKNIKYRREYFGGLLFDPRYWHIYQVNRISYQVLDFCWNKRTFEEIFEFISNNHFSFSKVDIMSFLNKLVDIEVLERYE